MHPKYVVSLELAEQLQDLGFPRNTDFYWFCDDREGWVLVDYFRNGSIAAPHLGELGEWLPGEIILNKRDEVYLSISKDDQEHRILYDGLDETGTAFCWENIFGKTEAEARANMLIWLAERKFIKPKLLWNTQK